MAMRYLNSDLSYRAVAAEFLTSASNVFYNVKKLRNGNLFVEKPRGGARAKCTKIKSVHKRHIQRWIESNDGRVMYLQEIKEKLQDLFLINVHTSTISKCLKKMGITRKRVSTKPREKTYTQEKIDRYEKYKHDIQTDPTLSIERVICIDETGVNDVTSQRSFGWAKKGEPCVTKRR